MRRLFGYPPDTSSTALEETAYIKDDKIRAEVVDKKERCRFRRSVK